MSDKVYVVALEQIWLGDVVAIENGTARRLRPEDEPLYFISLSNSNDVVWDVQESEDE